MSCESRHRAIVTDLLTMAGLHDTAPVDEVMRVGVAHRRRRGELPTPDAAAPVSLHADAQRTLDITGHSDQAAPAWVAALIDRLHTAAERGSRRAFLTLRWLTGGWDAITPLLTERDRVWLLTASRVGVSIPPPWEAWITRPRPAAVVGRLLVDPANDAVMLTEALDALIGIDTIPPDTAQAVTPLDVFRCLLGGSFTSHTDRQRVLRAILENAPVVRESVTLVTSLDKQWSCHSSCMLALIGHAARVHGRSVERAGVDAVLGYVAEQIQRKGKYPVDLTTLRNPSPQAGIAITDVLRRRGRRDHPSWIAPNWMVVSLTTLTHVWQTGGWSGAVTEVMQRLKQDLDHHQRAYIAFWASAVLIVTGDVHPPHGDALVAHLSSADNEGEGWAALAAGAVYATACRQIGHVPTVNGIENLIHHRWRYDHPISTPSPIPLLAVGREHELLLPALQAARGTDAWIDMILDIIDAVDMLDMVGGDSQPLLTVLTDVLTVGGSTLDPRIVVRLAASRLGQAILATLPIINLPLDRRWWNEPNVQYRLVYHLVSPRWATAPPYLRNWWRGAIRLVAQSKLADRLDDPPPLYPMVIPDVTVVRPTNPLVTRAVAHRQWATLPEEDRRACLETAFRAMHLGNLLQVVVNAATTTALRDIGAAAAAAGCLSDTDKGHMRQLIDPDTWGAQHEL